MGVMAAGSFLRGTVVVAMLIALATVEAGTQQVRKTIESEDGDTIDCVERDHGAAVLEPERSMEEMVAAYSGGIASKAQERHQTWRKGGTVGCPAGTVPIRRADLTRQASLSAATADARDWTGKLEVAAAYGTFGPYHGARAEIPYWSVQVHPDEFSMSYIMIGYTLDTSYKPGRAVHPPKSLPNQIMVGLMAWPSFYGDSLSRLFIYYTKDSGVEHKCFNLECGGFQLTSNSTALGSSWANSDSQIGGERFGVTLGIHRDDTKEIWWVSVQDQDIGYYPASAFDTRFPEGSYIEIGGRVLNTKPGGRHTTTPMGSTVLPCAGSRFAATIMQYLSISAVGELFKDPMDRTTATTPTCYDAKPLGYSNHAPGYWVAYGGPGGIYCDLPETG